MKKSFYLIVLIISILGCQKDDIITPATPKLATLESISLSNVPDTLVISKETTISVIGKYSDNTTRDLTDSVTITSDNSNVTIVNKKVYGAKSGSVQLNISYKDKTISKSAYINPIEYVTISDELKTKNKGKIRVPVVIINYLPTLDGIKLDMNRAPDGYGMLHNSTLLQAKNKILSDKIIEKNSIEEGTRFRDYGSNTINQYVDIDVVKYINVYELELAPYKTVTNSQGTYPIKTIDYNKLFPRLGIDKLVNIDGVKEIWFTVFGKDEYPSVVAAGLTDRSTYYLIPESNMSSPLTGDVSNSEQYQNDLPIYNNTYVVYGCAGHRGVDTDLHNRGHQMERQLSNYRTDPDGLFWGNFAKVGRCGWTHIVPNSDAGYDYGNITLKPSDIKTWKPSGGTYVDVNKNTWTNIKYNFVMGGDEVGGAKSNYENDPHTKWLIFWWQSIPGYNNQIPYGTKTLTNWWDIYYKWDETIKTNRKLYN